MSGLSTEATSATRFFNHVKWGNKALTRRGVQLAQDDLLIPSQPSGSERKFESIGTMPFVLCWW